MKTHKLKLKTKLKPNDFKITINGKLQNVTKAVYDKINDSYELEVNNKPLFFN